MIPLPNIGPSLFSSTQLLTNNYNQGGFRLDHYFRNNDQLFLAVCDIVPARTGPAAHQRVGRSGLSRDERHDDELGDRIVGASICAVGGANGARGILPEPCFWKARRRITVRRAGLGSRTSRR